CGFPRPRALRRLTVTGRGIASPGARLAMSLNGKFLPRWPSIGLKIFTLLSLTATTTRTGPVSRWARLRTRAVGRTAFPAAWPESGERTAWSSEAGMELPGGRLVTGVGVPVPVPVVVELKVGKLGKLRVGVVVPVGVPVGVVGGGAPLPGMTTVAVAAALSFVPSLATKVTVRLGDRLSGLALSLKVMVRSTCW